MRGLAFLAHVGGWLVLSSVSACSSGGGTVDPRCTSLCVIKEPSLAGAYDICSEASAERCRQDCAVRIASVSTVCASCLVEDADFGGRSATDGPGCAAGQCTISGRLGSCTYPQDDQAARDACIRQVSPRRTVECETTFRPVAECSNQCVASG